MNNELALVPTINTTQPHAMRGMGIDDIGDGTSNTILLGEKALMDGPFIAIGSMWGATRSCNLSITIVAAQCKMNTPFDGTWNNTTNCYAENTTPINLITRAVAASPHEGGCHFALADGSVKFISENVQANPTLGSSSATGNYVYQNLFNPNDGNPIGEF
jgi:prepilin-type processing-associated H-X9-DG protein